MTEEAGSEIVALICDHLSRVKQAFISRSNMDKVLKEEARHAVSEIGNMLKRLSGMFAGFESTLKKVIIATSGVPSGGGSTPHPPPKFRSFDKAEPNFQFCGKYIRNNLTRIRLSLIF